MAYPQALIRRKRFPWDELTPNGESVDELVRRTLQHEMPSGEQGAVIPFRRQIALPQPETAPANLSLVRQPIVEQPVTEQPKLERFTRTLRPDLPTAQTTPVDLQMPFARQPVIEQPEMGEPLPVLERPLTRPRLVSPEYSTGGESRLREVNPPGEIERQVGYIDQLRRNPVEKMPWWKRLGLGALEGLARGGIPGAIGGAAAGVISKDAIPQLRRQRQIERETGVLGQQLGVQKTLTDIESDRLQNQVRRDDLLRRPLKRGDDLRKQSQDYLSAIYRDLEDFDPVNNPEHRAMAEQARGVDMVLPAKAKGQRARPRIKQNGVWYQVGDDGTPEPIKGLPVDTSEVPDAEGFRPRDRALMRSREESRAEANSDQNYTDTRAAEERRAKNEEYRAQADVLDADAANLEFRARGNLDIDPEESARMHREAEQKRREARALRRQILPEITPRSAPTTTAPNPAQMTSEQFRTFISGIKKKNGQLPTQAEIDAAVERHRQTYKR